ncbi:MAG: RHS repeat-associated core domain-containing protein [Edaphobacter sp.]
MQIASRYTGKERDTESGLDYFGARYYGSSMGRFMSPDYSDDDDGPVSIPYYNPSNPQSLNLYSYVHNNPVTGTDPDGHDCVVQSRVDANHETVSVSSGTCAGVNVGSGQSATYVPGTVTGYSSNGGTSLDIGYNSYDGQSSGVENAKGAPAFDNPGIDGPANAAVFGQIGNQGMGAIKAFTVGSVVGGAVGGAVLASGVGAAALTTLGDLGSGVTEHAETAQLLARHGITPEQARAAIEAAKKSGDVVEAMGRYGPQLRYTANGIRVVVATTGRNAGKIITAFFK